MGKESLPIQLSEAMIRKEIEEAKKTDPSLLRYFNNFYGNFPGQFYRKMFERLEFDKGVSYLDVPLSKIIKADEGYSQKFRSITYREFFSEIDKIIEDESIDMARFNFVAENRMKYSEEFISLQTTPFIILRLRGYKRYPDLTV